MKYFFLALLILLVLLAVPGFIISMATAHKKKHPYGDLKDYDNEKHEPGFTAKVRDWLQDLEYGYIKIKSPYMYDINVLEIPKKGSRKWVILLHGVTVTHRYMMDLAYFYNSLGFNVLAWDSRNHGDTGGSDITYGYYEKYDLKAVVDFIRNREEAVNTPDITLGLHGISMGASILLAYAAFVRDDCDFYVADCPYSDFRKQVGDVSQRTLKLPDFIMKAIMFFTTVFSRMFFKYDMKNLNIASKIDKVYNPVMFVNCRDDDYIDPAMTEELYAKCASESKELLLFDEGGHAGAYPLHRKEYEEAVKKFLKL